MNVFVLNCGSSSLKFQIIKTGDDLMKKNEDITICKGLVERIGGPAIVSIKVNDKTALETEPVLHDHTEAIKYIIDWIVSGVVEIPGIKSLADINAVGHRTVHGAEDFNTSVIITDEVIASLEANIELAPLHNPANIMGIRAAIEVFGHDIPQVAVFDTSFHSTMPPKNYLYAIPYELYTKYKIRKYGFHGTSHRYVANRWREITGHSIEETNVITLHLGNGASMDCIKNGKSYDTTMGFTPLEGLVMGTRSGDIDPSVLEFIMKKENLDIAGAISILNKQSGVKGISGLTNDFRDLEGAMHDNPRAMLALNMFAQRIKKYIGSYMAELNGTKAIIFTGGIGENSIIMRQLIAENLENMGIIFDSEKNNNFKRGVECKLSADNSPIEIYIIPTNEELVIARDTFCIIAGIPCM
jgi:acetate kinase